MALGKPPVSGVRATDPRAINGAIDNIRRRLEAIEAALGQTELVAQVAANQSTLQVSNLAAQISSLDQRVTAIENTIDLDIGSYTAGESILAGQGVVGISSNTVGVADPSDPTRMFGLIGVAIDNGSVGSAVRVQRRGVYTVQGSPAFVTGRAVYLGDLGLTQTPDYEATALPIGVAVSASQVFVLPDWPAILYPAFSSGFADEYQRYLPVTYLAAQGMTDLEEQINALPFSSGVDAHALVPVTLGGMAMLVYAGDIAALAGGGGGSHNSLSGLQGGAPSEYYHLDAADYTALAGPRVLKGVDTTDDLIVDSSTTGLVLKDAQGTPHYWRVTVSTLGVLTTTDLGTTKP